MKVTSILITGRKWFDKVNGNTYFSAMAYINGKKAATIDYEYGYGEQYFDSMLTLLDEKQLIPTRVRHSNGSYERPREWAEKHGIELEHTAANVGRKKDL